VLTHWATIFRPDGLIRRVANFHIPHPKRYVVQIYATVFPVLTHWATIFRPDGPIRRVANFHAPHPKRYAVQIYADVEAVYWISCERPHPPKYQRAPTVA
jgi:hypothetical protein